MAEKVIAVVVFMIVLCMAGLFASMDSRINDLEYEIAQKEIIHNEEMEEVKKVQRITAQDVDFLERLVVEGGK